MLNKILIFPLELFIRGYQLIISPMLGSNCRFMPTCSEYAMESLKEYGLIKGTYLSIKRVGKCHPWGGHGYDPIFKPNGYKITCGEMSFDNKNKISHRSIAFNKLTRACFD